MINMPNFFSDKLNLSLLSYNYAYRYSRFAVRIRIGNNPMIDSEEQQWGIG